MTMTSAQAFTAVDQVASDKEIDQLLVDLLRYPSPQTERLEDDPQVKKFIAAQSMPWATWSGAWAARAMKPARDCC